MITPAVSTFPRFLRLSTSPSAPSTRNRHPAPTCLNLLVRLAADLAAKEHSEAVPRLPLHAHALRPRLAPHQAVGQGVVDGQGDHQVLQGKQWNGEVR